MTLELQSLLSFYAQRAARYNYLHEETAKDYERFILSLNQGDYTIRFKKLGLIYQFKSQDYQRKDYINDTLGGKIGNEYADMNGQGRIVIKE